MAEISPPFLLEGFARLALAPIPPGVLVVAGPSQGKTSLLDWLKGRQPDALRLDLADPGALDAQPAVAPAFLYLDNVHAGEAAFRALTARWPDARVVGTTERLFEGADRYDVLEPEHQSLADARRRHRTAWADAWHRAYPIVCTQRAGQPASSDLPDRWIDDMFDVTTGHPALVDRAFRLTLNYFAGRPDLSNGDVCAELMRDKSFLTSQLMGKAESVAERIVAWLDARGARADELRAAVLRPGQPDGLTLDQAKALRTAGLVHGPPDYLAWTSPDVLRPLVLRKLSGRGQATTPTIAIQAGPATNRQSGTLEIYPGTDGCIALNLRGRAWELVRTLHEANGCVVPIDKILEGMPGADTPQIVRSAVQRLTDRLKQTPAPKLIENYHGQGYALIPPQPREP